MIDKINEIFKINKNANIMLYPFYDIEIKDSVDKIFIPKKINSNNIKKILLYDHLTIDIEEQNYRDIFKIVQNKKLIYAKKKSYCSVIDDILMCWHICVEINSNQFPIAKNSLTINLKKIIILKINQLHLKLTTVMLDNDTLCIAINNESINNESTSILQQKQLKNEITNICEFFKEFFKK